MGLPPREKNEASWALKRELLATPALKPSPGQIREALDVFLAYLRLRYSSPLLRLPNAAAITAQMRILNTGPNQVKAATRNVESWSEDASATPRACITIA